MAQKIKLTLNEVVDIIADLVMEMEDDTRQYISKLKQGGARQVITDVSELRMGLLVKYKGIQAKNGTYAKKVYNQVIKAIFPPAALKGKMTTQSRNLTNMLKQLAESWNMEFLDVVDYFKRNILIRVVFKSNYTVAPYSKGIASLTNSLINKIQKSIDNGDLPKTFIIKLKDEILKLTRPITDGKLIRELLDQFRRDIRKFNLLNEKSMVEFFFETTKYKEQVGRKEYKPRTRQIKEFLIREDDFEDEFIDIEDFDDDFEDDDCEFECEMKCGDDEMCYEMCMDECYA